jgi:DNA-directed RNA polymerase omega subunit
MDAAESAEPSEQPDLSVQPEEPPAPPEPAPPIHSRFLFVDVAALRAKQLRRGARMRFEPEAGAPPVRKAERIAMEEVNRGLVYYQVPEQGRTRPEGQG